MSWFGRFREERARRKRADALFELLLIRAHYMDDAAPIDQERVDALIEVVRDDSDWLTTLLSSKKVNTLPAELLEHLRQEPSPVDWFRLSADERARLRSAHVDSFGEKSGAKSAGRARINRSKLPRVLELEDMLRGGYDEKRAIEVLDSMVQEGNTPRALRLARQLTARFPENSAHLSVRIAEHLSTRGQNDDAWAELESVREEANAPLAGLLLAGEICEIRGDETEALRYYERLLARDIDYPKARERAIRLRKNQGPRPNLAGATIATEGAFTRGRWRIERELGRGGAGTVFSAQDVGVDRRVALKVYHRRGKVERSRLIAEAQTPAALEHPGIIRIFDIDPELASIAMESVSGGSIRRAIDPDAAERVTLKRVQRWISTACEALAFVHQRGFVHRDIKPSNMLLRGCDQVVLTDFGLALRIGQEPVASGEGTLRYAPVEQRQNAKAEPSADMFAMGVTIDEVLAGLPPEILRPQPWTHIALQCQAEPCERPSAVEVLAVFSEPFVSTAG